MKKPTRGGKRKGAGRPKKEPTKVLSYRVVETNAKEIDQKIKEMIGSVGMESVNQFETL